MRARSFLVVVALTGCGLISGLDGLGVDDASTDATARDVANDSDNGDAATNDASDSGPIVSGSVICGSSTCNAPQHCCFAKGGIPMCSSADCAGGETRLNCDNHNDCSAQSVCCLSNNLATCTPSALCDGSVLCIVDGSPTGCGLSGAAVCKPLSDELPTTGACN